MQQRRSSTLLSDGRERADYQGRREAGERAVVRREALRMAVPVVMVFEPGFRMAGPGGWRALRRSFVAGLHERSVLVV